MQVSELEESVAAAASLQAHRDAALQSVDRLHRSESDCARPACAAYAVDIAQGYHCTMYMYQNLHNTASVLWKRSHISASLVAANICKLRLPRLTLNHLQHLLIVYMVHLKIRHAPDYLFPQISYVSSKQARPGLDRAP